MTSPYGSYDSQTPQNTSSSESAAPQNDYGQQNYNQTRYNQQYNAGNTYAQSIQYGFAGGINNGLSKPRPHVGFAGALRNYFKYMFRFTGRASRSEFWWVQLFWFVILFVVLGVGIIVTVSFGMAAPAQSSTSAEAASDAETGAFLSFLGTYFGFLILAFIQFITTLGLNWRRTQDAGMHGAFSLLQLTGLPVMLVFGFIPSSPNGYQYDAPSDYNRP